MGKTEFTLVRKISNAIAIMEIIAIGILVVLKLSSIILYNELKISFNFVDSDSIFAGVSTHFLPTALSMN
jgi:hypothetical protein